MMRRALSHKQPAPAIKYTVLDKPDIDENLKLTFGGSLLESNQYALSQLIEHLHNFVTSEGLFRKPGNKHRMEAMIAELESKPSTKVFNCHKYNAHDYASVLKKYLSELPEPLLMNRHLEAYLQTSGMLSMIIHKYQYDLFASLSSQLCPPSHHRCTVYNC